MYINLSIIVLSLLIPDINFIYTELFLLVKEETKKRVLTEYVGQEPEDLSKNNRKSMKTDEDNFVTHSESISPPIQESDNKGRCAQDKRYSLHHPLFPPRSIIHNRRKSSPTRFVNSLI